MPHRYPMLLVDAVYSLEPDTSIVAVKCITANEPCYAALPNDADVRRLAYPCSLIIESLGQAGGILWMYSAQLAGRDIDGVLMFVSARDCFFESDALPGDVMEHRVRLERTVGDAVFLSGETWVGQRRIARMEELMAVARPAYVLKR